MFTVIVPLYNKADHILKCVQSILAQTYPQFELIIVNDGSTDNSLQLLNELKDDRIKIISQQNAGVSTARNNGAKEAKYGYLAFLDADDWWDPHFLEEMKGLIEKYPDAGLYGSNFYLVKNSISHPSTVGLDKEFKAGYIDYFQTYANTFCVPINCSFVVLPKSIFDAAHGFKSHLKYGEDFDLWLRIALTHKVAYINKALAYSNQDVVSHNRALGGNKLYNKDEYFIFNLGYSEPYETKNEQLKRLMDGLRVRSLLRYYLSKKYVQEVRELLSKVNFNLQPMFFRLVYNIPLPVVKSYFAVMNWAAGVKKKITR